MIYEARAPKSHIAMVLQETLALTSFDPVGAAAKKENKVSCEPDKDTLVKVFMSAINLRFFVFRNLPIDASVVNAMAEGHLLPSLRSYFWGIDRLPYGLEDYSIREVEKVNTSQIITFLEALADREGR